MENNQYQSDKQVNRSEEITGHGTSLIESVVIPVIDEQIHIDKRTVETGQVRIVKTVQESEETIDVSLEQEAFDVERVPVNQPVATAPAVRYEGDTIIYPVLQEVVVVEKRLMLVEEVRVTKRRTTTTDQQRVVLRRETVTVERSEALTERSAPEQGSSL